MSYFEGEYVPYRGDLRTKPKLFRMGGVWWCGGMKTTGWRERCGPTPLGAYVLWQQAA